MRQQRRTFGGPRWRAAVQSATWPVRKAAWVVEEKVIWAGADAARERLETAKWPFEQAGWRIERRLVWPIQDTLRSRGAVGRSALAAGCVAIASAGVAAGLMVASDSGSSGPRPAPKASLAIAPAAKAPVQVKPDVTLQGPPPNFQSSPAKTGESAADAAAGSSAGSASAADAARPVEVPPSSIPAAPGGEKHALRAARDFATAFVLYEIGEKPAEVRRVFARTATPALVRALRERPPRLPGAVAVPEARVVNVILGERQRKQIDASVSLARLGNLSELRLTLVRHPEQGWAVSEVRG